MKHNLKITLLILAMFVVTQFIGVYVVNHYSPIKISEGKTIEVSAPSLPFGLETPKIRENKEFNKMFASVLIALVISISLLFLLTKIKAEFILKAWFFLVVVIALGISINSLPFLNYLKYSSIIALSVAIPLAFFKIYKRNFFVHNFTELLVYPGIASVFVPILNIWTVSALLVFISGYDIWAVWHSGIMQKMAKYQINNLNVFSGFFVPYISKKLKLKIEKMKRTMKKSELKKKKIKVNIALLGGGDVIFPIITAGVMLKTLGFLSAVFVIIGATIGLGYLMFFAEKKKFYPAMPFISIGIFAGIILSYLVL